MLEIPITAKVITLLLAGWIAVMSPIHWDKENRILHEITIGENVSSVYIIEKSRYDKTTYIFINHKGGKVGYIFGSRTTDIKTEFDNHKGMDSFKSQLTETERKIFDDALAKIEQKGGGK